VQYWDIIQRSFRIPWRHKYLWLLAFFSGEGGAGFSFSYSQPAPRRSGGSAGADFAAMQQQLTDWLNNHLALIVTGILLSILVLIGFFILAAVCEGALVRASAEHDVERPFGLGSAWRTGRATMGTIIRFRLLLTALALPVFVLVLALAAGFVFAIIGHNAGALIGLVLIVFLVVLATIPYLIYLSFLDRLGTRAAVLEQVGAKAAIGRAHRLLFKRLGRVLLVWLLGIGMGIGIAIGLAVVGLILALPLLLVGLAAYAGGPAVLWVVVAVGLLIVVPLLLVVQAYIAAAFSTYWTLAFRRLEVDPAPAYGYPAPYLPPQPGTA
jgi:hypothetical protein